MRADRLLALAAYQEQIVKDEQWDLLYWWRCGTVGCSIGHAAQIWPEAGLIAYNDRSDSMTRAEYEACFVFFGLSGEEFDWLFDHESDHFSRVDRFLQAKRIRAFVAAGGIPDADPAQAVLDGRTEDSSMDDEY